MNQSGQTSTLGAWLAGAGGIFVFLSPILGWLGVAVTGSDTSSNALFGALQVQTAAKAGLDPLLLAAANSSGGVLGKMVSPQNLAIAAAAVGMAGQEGDHLPQGARLEPGAAAVHVRAGHAAGRGARLDGALRSTGSGRSCRSRFARRLAGHRHVCRATPGGAVSPAGRPRVGQHPTDPTPGGRHVPGHAARPAAAAAWRTRRRTQAREFLRACQLRDPPQRGRRGRRAAGQRAGHQLGPARRAAGRRGRRLRRRALQVRVRDGSPALPARARPPRATRTAAASPWSTRCRRTGASTPSPTASTCGSSCADGPAPGALAARGQPRDGSSSTSPSTIWLDGADTWLAAAAVAAVCRAAASSARCCCWAWMPDIGAQLLLGEEEHDDERQHQHHGGEAEHQVHRLGEADEERPGESRRRGRDRNDVSSSVPAGRVGVAPPPDCSASRILALAGSAVTAGSCSAAWKAGVCDAPGRRR